MQKIGNCSALRTLENNRVEVCATVRACRFIDRAERSALNARRAIVDRAIVLHRA